MITPGLGAPGISLQGRDVEPVIGSVSAVTGFVGIAERGPMNLPQPIYSWDQFLQIFGDFIDYGYLADAVFNFFLNGGEKCWCVRVGELKDRSSENISGQCPKVDLLLPAESRELVDRDQNPSIRIFAINEGSWGNAIRFEIVEESSREIALTELCQEVHSSSSTFAVDSVLDFAPGQILRITHATNPFIQRQYTIASVDSVANTITIIGTVGETFSMGSTVFGHGFRVIVRCGNQQEIFEDLSMTSTHERYFARVINGDTDATQYLMRLKRGNSILVRVEHLHSGGQSRFRPIAVVGMLSGGGDGFTFAQGILNNKSGQPTLRVIATTNKGSVANGTRIIADAFNSPIALAVPLSTGHRDRFASADAQFFRAGENVTLVHKDLSSVTETATITSVEPDGFIYLSGDLTNDYSIGSSAIVVERFDLSVFEENESEPHERYRALAISAPTTDGYVKTELETNIASICTDPLSSSSIPVGEVMLAGGVNPGEIDFRYYTGYEKDGRFFVPAGGDPSNQLGLATLEQIDEVSQVAIPDLSRGLVESKKDSASYSFIEAQKLILFHCAKMGERMALLDLMPETQLVDAANWPANFNDPRLAKFGALYYPWVLTTTKGAKERWIPPCGVVAGAFSASDSRHGLGKAPANLSLLGIAATQVDLDRAEQDGLNPRGVNCIRKLEDGQINLMGSRTLASQLNTRYVNSRRVLLAIVKTLSKTLLWAVFEPNGPDLWKRIEATISSFMTSLVSKGMTAGSRPGEAFFVKCNAETNSAESVNAGQVLAEIGVALTAPAEFILITARRTPESLNIIEEET